MNGIRRRWDYLFSACCSRRLNEAGFASLYSQEDIIDLRNGLEITPDPANFPVAQAGAKDVFRDLKDGLVIRNELLLDLSDTNAIERKGEISSWQR
jgi:hypothetical protein